MTHDYFQAGFVLIYNIVLNRLVVALSNSDKYIRMAERTLGKDSFILKTYPNVRQTVKTLEKNSKVMTSIEGRLISQFRKSKGSHMKAIKKQLHKQVSALIE